MKTARKSRSRSICTHRRVRGAVCLAMLVAGLNAAAAPDQWEAQWSDDPGELSTIWSLRSREPEPATPRRLLLSVAGGSARRLLSRRLIRRQLRAGSVIQLSNRWNRPGRYP